MASGRNSETARLLGEAEAAAASRDWARVLDACDRVLSLDTANREAHTLLVRAVAAHIPGPSPAPEDESAGAERLRLITSHGLRDGRYRLQVRDVGQDRDAELTISHADVRTTPATLRAQKALASQSVPHPRVAAVYHVGNVAGRAFAVAAPGQAQTVGDALRKRAGRGLPVEDAVAIGARVAEGLGHMHRAGIVHRDVKPGNIGLTRAGEAILEGFDLAALAGDEEASLRGNIVGTPAYMPPEQAMGRAPRPESDLYGLGATLYEMLTGRPPFPGDDLVSVVTQHLSDRPVAPSWHHSAIPDWLDTVVLRLLAKDPLQRPSAEETARLLADGAPHSDTADDERPEANPIQGLAHGAFVGRRPELEALRARFAKAAAGRGGAVFVLGEPGMGKSRLTRELATGARLDGARILQARCADTEGAPAFWPWIQAIRDYLDDATSDTARLELGIDAGPIAQLVPDVRRLVPGLPEPPEVEPEEARFRLFDSMTRFFGTLARTAPLVILIDDLHWADSSTVRLLQFLVQEIEDRPVLIIGTCRDTEADDRSPFGRALGEMSRLESVDTIRLDVLARDEVARLMSLILGRPADRELADSVFAKTRGNPLFVHEIVRLLAASDGLATGRDMARLDVGALRGVREVIRQRLGRLSPGCRVLLKVASVAGEEFDRPVLEAVMRRPSRQLARLIDEAERSRLIEPREPEPVPGAHARLGFVHPLMRETLYERIPGARRAVLHGSIASAVLDVFPEAEDTRLSELAFHCSESAAIGHADRAVEFSVRAGRNALGSFAFEDAAGHFERALLALDHRGDPDPGERCELLLALGEAYGRASLRSRSAEAYDRAAAIARTLKDGERLARSALGLSAAQQEVIPETRARRLEEALALIGPEDTILRAKLLAHLSAALLLSPPRERTARLGEEAIAVARRVGHPQTIGFALLEQHRALFGSEDAARLLTVADEAVRIGRDHADSDLELSARLWRFLDLLELGDVRAADEEHRVHAEIAGRVRKTHQQWQSVRLRAMRALFAGEFEEAEQRNQEAFAIGQRIEEPLAFAAYAANAGQALMERGDFETVAASIRQLASQFPQLASWQVYHALTSAHLGDLDAARESLARLARNDFEAIPPDMSRTASLAMLVDTCDILHEPASAATLYRLLAPREERNIILSHGWGAFGAGSRFLGILALTMGRGDDAERHFAHAVAMNERMGARPALAHSLLGYARTLALRKDRHLAERAVGLANQALSLATELGMKGVAASALSIKVDLQGVGGADIHTSIAALVAAAEQDSVDLSRAAASDGGITLFFSDIEGSTALNERLGDARWIEILTAHNAILDECIARHGGRTIKTIGDGYMVAFPSPELGVRCALEVQSGLTASTVRGIGDAGIPLRVRIGLHAGRVVEVGGDLFGREVNLAARVASSALGGEILVSEPVAQRLGTNFDVRQAQQVELKGIREPQRLFKVVAPA